jgi:hypothetical protein
MVCVENGILDRLASVVHVGREDFCAELRQWDASLGSGDCDHIALLPLAARGDVEAMRHLALIALVKLNEGGLTEGSPDLLPLLLEAGSFQRLAAVAGEDSDRVRLVSVLALTALFTGDRSYSAEALAWLEILADHGHAFIDKSMLNEAGNEPADVLAAANEIHAAFVRFGVGQDRERVR